MKYRNSEALYREASQHLAGGVSSNFRYLGYGESPTPIFYDRAAGARLHDVDGNVFIDYAAANGPTVLGHAPKSVLDAVADALPLGQLFAGQHRLELDLARRICELVPCADMVRFASSGSEADQAAVRLARAFTGRAKIVKFEGHYHGWFDNLFASVNPALSQAGPASAPLTVGHSIGQAESALSDTIVMPWNDLDALTALLDARGGEIAAVVMEPILCNTGAIRPRAGYLEGVRELTRRHGVVLIFDEVITGFRISLGGAQGHLGVTPDLAVFAKAVAGGFPLAVLAGRRDIMELVLTKNVMHGGTYNACLPAIAAGLATLHELSRDDGAVLKAIHARGEALMRGLQALADRHGQNMQVRGFGAVFHPAFTDGGDFHDYRGYLGTDAKKRQRFNALLHEEGVRVTARGTWFMSAAHTDEDVEQTLHMADRAFAKLKAE
ncbi:MAG: aspartate aminotransferase family protein [Parvibaculaceae bacterium]